MSITRLQGLYYLVGGVWPLVHLRSFEAVVGPKPDRFQTQVASALFAAAGSGLLVGTRTDAPLSDGTRVLAGVSSAAVALVTLRYRKDVRMVLRADAVVEVVFALAAARSRR